MTFFQKQKQNKIISDSDLAKFDANSYPLGAGAPWLRLYPSIVPSKALVTVSTENINEQGNSGLLILGSAGTGKTFITRTIARKATLSGNNVLRFNPHDSEHQKLSGIKEFTKTNEFNTALIEMGAADSVTPTVIIIDCVHSYLREGKESGSASTGLTDLLSLKKELEERFTGNILFVFTLQDLRELELLRLLQDNVAMTVTGRINAHYEIGKLLNNSGSHLFYTIAELKTGEFIVINKNMTYSKGFRPVSFRAFTTE